MTAPRSATLILWVSIAMVACAEPPLDTTRQIPERGTLGEEIFRLFHRDLEREAPRRADGFALERDGFVGAVDHLFPQDELSDTQAFLVRSLPLYDDDTVPELTRRLAAVGHRLADNSDALTSLTTLSNRTGYVDPSHAQALQRRIANFPQYKQLATKLLDLALAHDGLDADGEPDAAEDPALHTLLTALTKSMRELELSVDDERDIVLLGDFLLSEDQRLATQTAGPTIVARDLRGLAKVVTPNGAVPAPFADVSPPDGMADIDVDGRFVDARGSAIIMPPFGDEGARDQKSRAVTIDRGDLIYQYVDLDSTILAGVARDARRLMKDGLPMKTVRTLEAFLGERGEDGMYSTYNNELLELVHAGTYAVDFPELPELLEVLQMLLDRHPETLTWILVEMDRQFDIADSYDVSLAPGATMFDDLMSIIRRVLREPGLAEALLDAVEDPAILNFPTASALLSQNKKTYISHQDFEQGRIFGTPVDRSTPDRPGNYSLHQRMLHLLFDTRGARYEPSFIGLPLGFIFEIDDLAEFYLLSIIGETTIPSLIQTLTGLPETPTPIDLSIFINEDQQFGNPQGHEGIDVKDNDGDTLFVVSASGMADGLRPLIRVFHDHGQLRMLFDVFEVLHLHWASGEGDYQSRTRREPKYSKLSGVKYYEPLMADVYTNAKVLDSVRKLLVDTKSMRTSSGKSAREVLLGFARRLMRKDSTVKTRDGEGQVLLDGQRITPLSPFDLMRGALDGVDTIVKRRAKTHQEWNDVTDVLHEIFLQTERAGAEAGKFTNPRTLPVLTAAVELLRDRAIAHKQKGDLSEWIRQDVIKAVEDLITAEELPAALDLIHIIDEDEALSSMLGQLRDELLEENNGFGDLLVVAGDQLASAKDAVLGVPWVRFLGTELDPQTKLLFHAVSVTKKLMAADGEDRVLEIARRGLEEAPDGELYLDGFFRSIKQANRVNPLDTGPVITEDTRRITTTVADYLVDGEHGIDKFIELAKARK